MTSNTKQLGAVLAAFAVLLSGVAPALAAGGLNYSDSGKAPNPYIAVDSVTVEDWDNSEFDSPLEYYDDSGEAAELPATVNRSDDPDKLGNGTVNPISVTATDIDVEEFGGFPRKDGEDNNKISVLHADEWTTSGATVSNVTTAPGVSAVEYAGTASSDSSSYSDFSITSSVEKRYVQIGADISSASGTPTFEVHDSDGDYVVVELYNSSADASDAAVLANSTGEGQVLQTQVGKLEVKGSGDGTMGEMTKIVVSGDVNADFSLINLEKTGQYTFGQKYVESDNSDDLETEDITEPNGEYRVHSVDTFGSTLDNAVFKGLSVTADFRASDLASSDVKSSFEKDNAFPNWDTVADLYYKISLPSAYDLSYSGVTLVQEQQWPGTRYVTLEVAEGVGDTEFSDISSWSSKASSFDNQDKTHTLDSTVSVGTEYAIHIQLKLTGDEASAMQTAGGSGGAGIFGGGSGGIMDTIFGLPGLIAGAVVGLFGRSQGWF